jgi:multidrug resistance efflux pump
MSRLQKQRRGNTFAFVAVSVAVVAVLAFVGWWMFSGRGGDEAPDLILNTASKGPYDYVVIELRCEVRSRGGGGGGGGGSSSGGGSTTIIEVVPEGTQVAAGDIVVKLDSSNLEQERDTQRIAVAGRQAAVIQAENTLAAAEIAREEYLKGTFVQDEKLIEGEVFVAQQGMSTAQLQLESARRLEQKGIVTALQVQTAQFNLENSQKQLEMGQTKLNALRRYTREKMLKEFDSNIATAQANVAAQKSSLALEEDKLHDIEEQIEKCTIKAPQPGQVVYANQYDSWRGSSSAEFVVAPGVAVRERQVIIRLPNPLDMQVKATVNEARVTLVRPGLPVTIRVDALKDEVIEGVVTKVNQYAEPGSFSSGNIKKYATFIKILNPPEGLRSGMNAEVRIHVERKSEALQVPVQALAEYKGHFFTLVKTGEKYLTREVKINSTNDKVATIQEGLKEGDEVVMNPRSAGDLLILPDLPDPTPAQMAEIQRATGAPITLASGAPGGPAGAAPGATGADGKGGRGGKGAMTPQAMVDRYLQSDADKDGKLSKAELDSMDERPRQALADADKDKDGFLDSKELNLAAGQAVARMRAKMQECGGGGEGRGGGRRGGGEGGGPPGGGAGPAGGEQ